MCGPLVVRVLRIVGEGFDLVWGETHAAGEDFADLAAIDVERGDDDVGGLVVTELHNELGRDRFQRRWTPAASRCGIELEFLCRESSWFSILMTSVAFSCLSKSRMIWRA